MSWSLACEVFFYAAFPIAVMTFGKLSAGRRRLVGGGLLLVPFAIALLAPPATHPAPSAYWIAFFPLSRLPEFLLGILLASEVRDGTWFRTRPAVAGVLALAAIAVTGIWLDFRYSVCITLVPYVLLIGAFATADIEGRRSPLRHGTLIRLGQWSYALYLVHYFVMTAGKKIAYGRTLVTTGVVWLLVAGLSIAVAGVLYHWWERPFERLLRPGRTDRSEEALGPAR